MASRKNNNNKPKRNCVRLTDSERLKIWDYLKVIQTEIFANDQDKKLGMSWSEIREKIKKATHIDLTYTNCNTLVKELYERCLRPWPGAARRRNRTSARSRSKTELSEVLAKSPSITSQLISASELGEKFQLSRRTIIRWNTLGKLPTPCLFVNRSPFWKPAVIEAWISSKKTNNPSSPNNNNNSNDGNITN